MKLSSTRDLSGNRDVLKDPNSTGPDPVYWVFSEVSESSPSVWTNVTIIAAGLYNSEYPKTFGHYHGVDVNETYHLIEGEGVLQMQKKHFESGVWVEDQVDQVYLIKAKPGDEILITPEWGHSWSNVGKGVLISFDNWRSGHTPQDYENIKKLQGLAYYLVNEAGSPKAIPNPNYQNLPQPQWVTADDFRQLQKGV